MYRSTITAALLLVSQVLAGGVEDAGLVTKGDIYLGGSINRYADDAEALKRGEAATIVRRENTTEDLVSELSTTQWDEQTMLACTTSLEALNGVATNDAGMAVCYNLPMYNATTGVFKADMRLFKIAEPTGSFAAIPSSNVLVGVAYVGASVQPVSAAEIGRRSEVDEMDNNFVSLISWSRSSKIESRAANVPNMTHAYAFVGQINAEFVGTNMTDAQIEQLVTPTVTLTGTTISGSSVNTTINSTQASFVSGYFAEIADVAVAAVAQPMQTLVYATDELFILPGTQILIFPIGGIITGTWAILLMSTIAYGTVGRMQFRDQFRQRQLFSLKGDRPTI
ncbi:hypothetical protein BJ878DRAFT_208740 [Calycina marina]|uniref:Uncharacterized protein n=1 Tax=Calycina marina TaxID=1763456 RepID=A0A9P7YY14_9HELO|nr:hypothetical protein BJ878DRAFT_208740 [Calycina marina]